MKELSDEIQKDSQLKTVTTGVPRIMLELMKSVEQQLQ